MLRCSGSKLTKDIITCIYEPTDIWVGSEWTASYDAECIVTAVVEANAINFWHRVIFIPSSTAEAAGSVAAATGLIYSVASKFNGHKPPTVVADCSAAAVTNGASTVASAAAVTTTAATATVTATTAAAAATITATTSHAYAAAAFAKGSWALRPKIS